MKKKFKIIHQQPDLHFTICSSNKELFTKFENAFSKQGLIGIPDLQGKLHYLVDGRKGFPTAYKKVHSTTLKLMEEQVEEQTDKVNKCKEIAKFLINKYEFDKSLIGTKFIRYMIIYCLLDKSLLLSFSKSLYPAIADIFDSTTDKICYSTRYSLRKLENFEKTQRDNKIHKEYLLPGDKPYSNKSAIYKLISEGEAIFLDDPEHSN